MQPLLARGASGSLPGEQQPRRGPRLRPETWPYPALPKTSETGPFAAKRLSKALSDSSAQALGFSSTDRSFSTREDRLQDSMSVSMGDSLPHSLTGLWQKVFRGRCLQSLEEKSAAFVGRKSRADEFAARHVGISADRVSGGVAA